MKQIRTVARLFFGVMPPRDGETKSDPRVALLQFYSNDKMVEQAWSTRFKNSGSHPERFLLDSGFVPVGDTLYIFEDFTE
jgi:hypothetical protein